MLDKTLKWACLKWAWMGKMPYREALLAMDRVAEAVERYNEPGRIMFLEHPPTVSLGRRATEDDLRVPAGQLENSGVAVIKTDRGGRATYHGPGQLVTYPVVDLKVLGLGIEAYVTALEKVVRRVLKSWDVGDTWSEPGLPGVWSGRGKIASIGLRVKRNIATHGLAININVDKSHFDFIFPCGMKDSSVAHVANVADFTSPPGMAEAAGELAKGLGEEFGLKINQVDAATLIAQLQGVNA